MSKKQLRAAAPSQMSETTERLTSHSQLLLLETVGTSLNVFLDIS